MTPRVSVGLPVYNGERYLREAVDSILAQTYTDFELIISDNGSTDATEAICRHYASMDARIRYVRNDMNRGVSWNFRKVFELAEGYYFMWMAHDDACDPELIEKCVYALDENPSAVACSSRLAFLDENSSIVGRWDVERHLSCHRPSQRYYTILRDSSWALEIHGLMRSHMLRNTPLIASYPGSDRTLLARLVLIGPFVELQRYLYRYRLHPLQSISLDRFHYAEWFKPGCDGRLQFPQWRLYWEYLLCIHSTPLPLTERLLCYLHLLRWPTWERNWRRLGKDILVGIPALSAAVVRRASSATLAN